MHDNVTDEVVSREAGLPFEGVVGEDNPAVSGTIRGRGEVISWEGKVVTTTFEFETKRGLAEGAIAYSYKPRSFFDRVLRRQRVAFGIGLCSPKDRVAEPTKHELNLGGMSFTVVEPARYVLGKTERIAEGRLDQPRRASEQKGFSGTFSIPAGSELSWTKLHDLVVDATPDGWWKRGVKPYARVASCGEGDIY